MPDSSHITTAAPYTPRQCVFKLQEFATSSTWLTQRTRIKFKRAKNGSIQFRLTRSVYSIPTNRYKRSRGRHVNIQSNYLKIQVVGHLTPWADPQSTLVTMRVQTLPQTYLVNGAFLLMFGSVMLVLTLFSLSEFICLLPVMLISLTAYMFATVIQPAKLAEKHKTALIRHITETLHELKTGH